MHNHTESRGVWEHFPLEKLSQFMALRLPLRSVLNQNSTTICSLICNMEMSVTLMWVYQEMKVITPYRGKFSLGKNFWDSISNRE